MPSGRAICATTRPTPTGPTATALSSPAATVPCSSIASCTLPATISLDELKNFRQWGSHTPGHPECGLTPGVETTTGPLGQGFANGVGMAMAEAHLAAVYNRPGHDIIDHYTYAIVTDGDLMEGVTAESASLAGHLQLGKLIYLYDDNNISIEGSTELTFTEDRGARFEAYGWQVLYVADGEDVAAIDRAITEARSDARPSLIIVRTIIGYGAANPRGYSQGPRRAAQARPN